jgi:hypothetical protein
MQPGAPATAGRAANTVFDPLRKPRIIRRAGLISAEASAAP